MSDTPSTLERRLPPFTRTDDALAVAHALLAGQLAPTSIAMYARDVRAYLRFAGTPTAALDAATLARWRAHLAANTPLSPHTINCMLAAVKRLIKEAAVQGHLDQDVAKAFTQIGGAAVVGVAGRTYEHTIIVGDAGGSSRQSVKGIP